MQRLHMLEVAQRFGGLALVGEVRCVEDSDAGDSIEDDYAENDDPYYYYGINWKIVSTYEPN
eukprot:461787-Prorocentrum_minimum.AAC.1